MKLSLMFSCVVFCAFVSCGLSRPFDPEESLEEAEVQLILSRMRRHQADSLFTHFRRRNKINLMRKMYLQSLINGIDKRDESGPRVARSAELPSSSVADEIQRQQETPLSLAELEELKLLLSSSPESLVELLG